jgi:NADPH-dependent 7-cyano-7-deazaguanine reductase QueF-like protein
MSIPLLAAVVNPIRSEGAPLTTCMYLLRSADSFVVFVHTFEKREFSNENELEEAMKSDLFEFEYGNARAKIEPTDKV